MNHSILIITPFFAPQSHAAVFRAYKLAKYLPQHGWDVHIVTTDTNYLYNEDHSLLDALPSNVQIHRTRYVEPSIRGVRMALGGKDRTYKTLKASLSSNINSEPIQSNSLKNIFVQVYVYLRRVWLNNPDQYWTWEASAVRHSIKLIRNNNIPIIMTSALPYTSYRIGYRIKQLTDVRWVADFRDPATHARKMISSSDRVFLKQRQLEQLAVDHADIITVLSKSYALILTEMYGLSNNHAIQFITTGLDKQLLFSEGEGVDIPKFPYFIFIGEYIPSYDEGFFQVFAQCLQNPQVTKTDIRLLVIGNMSLNKPRLQPIIDRYGLNEHVEFIDHLPQQQLYQYIQQAKAALLIPGKRVMWWNLFAKLVDYIALKIPTIAIVPDPSEARTHLQKSGLGIFLDGDNELAITTLTEFILSNDSPHNVNEEYCQQFHAQSQVNSFVAIFDTLL